MALVEPKEGWFFGGRIIGGGGSHVDHCGLVFLLRSFLYVTAGRYFWKMKRCYYQNIS
jgi:hypothetical protein